MKNWYISFLVNQHNSFKNFCTKSSKILTTTDGSKNDDCLSGLLNIDLQWLDFFIFDVKYLSEITSLLMVVVLILFLLYCFCFGLVLVLEFFGIKTGNIKLNLKFIKFIEEEVSAINDVFFFIFILSFFITSQTIIIFLFGSLNSFWLLISYIISIVILLIFFVPLTMVFNFGLNSVAYIIGSSSKGSTLKEYPSDIIGTFAYFLRINIQLIRFVLLTVTFLTYNEIYLNEARFSFLQTVELTNSNTLFDYVSYGLLEFCKGYIRLLFELSHFWVIFFIQGNTLIVIVLILMQFLYTLFIFNKLCEYYKIKKL